MGGKEAWVSGKYSEISKCSKAEVSPLQEAKSEEHLAAGCCLPPRVLISMCGFSSKPESASEGNE